MQTLEQIRTLLQERGLRPRRALGQNFLIDHNLIRKLVDASGVTHGSLVLEVGPGTGTMTEELLERGAEVLAVELDPGLAELLGDRFAGRERFTLLQGDCLTRDRRLAPHVLQALGERTFALVSNLPYGAASPLISDLLVHHPRCAQMWVTVQREVADKLTAHPGSRAYGPMAVLVWALAQVQQLATLPPQCFWPRPEVTSAMVGLRRLRSPRTDDPQALSDFLRILFQNRRKQLRSVLGRDFPLPEGLSHTLRAEQLPPERILDLCRAQGVR